MIFVFYFFAAIAVFLGCKSLQSGNSYLEFFKKEIAKKESDFAPFCSIIVPCRGLDDELSENLSALFRQNYPRYEIIFVVDDESDKAVSVIEKLSENAARETKLIVAGKAAESGQKVHNLRKAVLEVSDKSKVFVFTDSDARTGSDWLKNLVAALEDETVGAATGYRWFVSRRGGFFSQILSVWNASIASALGANEKNNFCWGGSMAVRRETFEKLAVREKWRGAVSDDFALTSAVKKANLRIRFVPQCLIVSFEDYAPAKLLEFTTRQMKITRVYAPHLWKASFAGAGFFILTFWLGLAILFLASGFYFWTTLAFLILIFALGAAKSFLRLQAAKLVLENFQNEISRQLFWHVSLWTLTPLLYFYNCFCALLSRAIVWRGIEYKLQSATETLILGEKSKTGDDKKHF